LNATCVSWSANSICSASAQAEVPVLTVEEAVGLSVGIVVAIVVSVVVVIALLGVGGKKLYDYYQSRDLKMRETQSNPMYQENKNSGTNPMYDEHSRHV